MSECILTQKIASVSHSISQNVNLQMSFSPKRKASWRVWIKVAVYPLTRGYYILFHTSRYCVFLEVSCISLFQRQTSQFPICSFVPSSLSDILCPYQSHFWNYGYGSSSFPLSHSCWKHRKSRLELVVMGGRLHKWYKSLWISQEDNPYCEKLFTPHKMKAEDSAFVLSYS